MLSHYIVISLFQERYAAEAKLGPQDPDLAHQSVANSFRAVGIKPAFASDPMWYLVREGRPIGYVKVFKDERYARNWFRDLAEQEASTIVWAFWRDSEPLALLKNANVRDANQFVKSMCLCKVRAFSAHSAAENGWRNWITGRLTAIDVFIDGPRKVVKPERRAPQVAETPHPRTAYSVEASEWKVAQEAIRDGRRPAVELSRFYSLSGLPSPQPTAVVRIVCRIESTGLVGSIDDETSNVGFFRRPSFYLRPFSLPRDADFIVGLSTADQSMAGLFEMVGSPVDPDTATFTRFYGKDDVTACLNILMASKDLIFTVADKTESLVRFRLPNDSKFKQQIDEAGDWLAKAEVSHAFLRPQMRR